jgi:hypothetical protein
LRERDTPEPGAIGTSGRRHADRRRAVRAEGLPRDHRARDRGRGGNLVGEPVPPFRLQGVDRRRDPAQLHQRRAGRLPGRFAYLRKALGEIERTWIAQFERGKEDGLFRADLDPRLTYRLLRDVLWIPSQWGATGGYATDQVADAILRLLFDGILNRAA